MKASGDAEPSCLQLVSDCQPARHALPSRVARWVTSVPLDAPAELAPLPKCVEPNPINPSWEPMHLYRRLDVRRAAIDRWGSWEQVAAEHRRRLTRR